MKFEIIEFDRDYRTMTNREVKDFATEKEAEDWCTKNSWTGYDYFINKKYKEEV